MSKIDVSQWKEFNIGKLFDFYRGKEAAPNRVPDGDIPFISETRANNGMVKLASSEHIFPGKSITVSVNYASTVLYQEKDFCASVNIIVLHNDKLTVNAGLFLVAVISKLHQKYSYNDKVSAFKLKQENIKLPVTSSGEPDWQYMDSYIAKRAALAHKYVSELAKTKDKPEPLKINGWKEFKLTELFTVNSGTKFDKRRVILTPEPHNINFIGRTGSLNGINAKCGMYKNTEPFSAGLLTVALGGTIGACFVQDKPFYTSQNVDVLIPLKCYVSKMTWNVKQFIASCIFYESQNNYLTFVRELNKHIKRDFVIKLPVDSTGHPDWQYMDSYISKRAALSHHQLQALKQVVH